MHTGAMFKNPDGKRQCASPLTSKFRSIAIAAMIVLMLATTGYILGIDASRIEMPTTGKSIRQLGPTPQITKYPLYPNFWCLAAPRS